MSAPAETRAEPERFELRAELGAGTLGSVFEAWDRSLGCPVALKRLRRPDPVLVAHLRAELRVARQLVHPNLARLYELVVEDDDAFLVMELVRGQSFASALATALHAGEVQVALGLTEQLVLGLSALHDAGFVHRDVKPENVLVATGGRVVVIDFELALAPGQTAVRASGTPRYMAPEVLWGQVGPAADWFAAGVLLAEALGHADAGARRPSAARLAASLPSDAPAFLATWIHGLLESDPGGRATGRELLEALGRPTPRRADVPFVGRDDELAALLDELAAARDGKPRAVMIAGAAGMGKSALLARFLGLASAGASIARIACSHAECFPLAAVEDLAAGLAPVLISRELDAEQETQRRAASVAFPVLRRPSDAPPAVPAVPAEARGRAQRALGSLLESLSRDRALVIAVEDAHFADPESAALLTDWLRKLGACRLLFVATWRTDAIGEPDWVMDLEPTPRVVPVGPLDSARSRQLADALGAPDPDALVAECAGSPLAILQGGATLVLGEPAQRLADVLSLAYAPLPRGVAARAAALDDDALRVIVELETHRVARSAPDARGLVPYHDLVRRSALARLTAEQARSAHSAIADALVEAGSDDLELLVPHLRDAGRATEAAPLARRAADAARASLAFEREATHLRWSLDGSPASDRPGILRRIAEAWHDGGYLERAAAAFDEASVAAPKDGGRELRLLAAEAWIRAGHVERGSSAMLVLLAEAGIRPPRSDATLMASGLARRAMFLLRPSAPARSVPEVSAEEDRLDLLYRAGNSLSMTRVALAYDLTGRFLRGALRAPSRERLVQALGTEAAFAASLGGPFLEARAERMLAQVDDLAHGGPPLLRAGRAAYRAIAAWGMARWGEARAHAKGFEEIVRTDLPGHAWHLRVNAAYAASALFFAGDVDDLRVVAREELAAAIDRGDPMGRVHLSAGEAGLAHLLDDAPRGAWEALLSTEPLAPVRADIETYYRTMLAANALLYERRFAEAGALLATRHAILTKGGVLAGQIPRAWYAFTQARAAFGADPFLAHRSTHRALGAARKVIASRSTPAHRAFLAHVELLRAGPRSAPDARASVAAAYLAADMRLFAWALDPVLASHPGVAHPERTATWLDPSRLLA